MIRLPINQNASATIIAEPSVVSNIDTVFGYNAEFAHSVAASSVVINATASAPSDMKNQRDCTALARIFSTGERFVEIGVGDSCIRPCQAIGRPKYAYKRASHKPPYGRRFLVNTSYTSASISFPCSSSHARLA